MSVCFSGSLAAYSAVIILVCFMLCWRIKYDDDDNVKGGHQANLILGDKEVSQQDCVKDLGVLVDQHLKFEEHIHVVTRASRVANLIHKCFVS